MGRHQPLPRLRLGSQRTSLQRRFLISSRGKNNCGNKLDPFPLLEGKGSIDVSAWDAVISAGKEKRA